jgi:hypothetical protein
MPTITAKRLEITVESLLVRRVEQLLIASGVKVFTVLEGKEARWLSGSAFEDASGDAVQPSVIVAVTGAEAADAAVGRLAQFFERYPGMIYVSDVQVLRGERF